MAKGTMMRPPRDIAAELMLIAMPLLRLNHRDIKAAVLERAGPLWAMETTIPNMNTRKKTLLVWEIRMVPVPRTARVMRIMFRPPVRSNTWPMNG